MLARLITAIVCLVLLAFFAGFNLDNKCDVNLLFRTFEDVPVFVSIIIAFVAGVIFTLPFVFIRRRKAEKKEEAKVKAEKKSKSFGFFKSKKENAKTEETEQNASENKEISENNNDKTDSETALPAEISESEDKTDVETTKDSAEGNQ